MLSYVRISEGAKWTGISKIPAELEDPDWEGFFSSLNSHPLPRLSLFSISTFSPSLPPLPPLSPNQIIPSPSLPQSQLQPSSSISSDRSIQSYRMHVTPELEFEFEPGSDPDPDPESEAELELRVLLSLFHIRLSYDAQHSNSADC